MNPLASGPSGAVAALPAGLMLLLALVLPLPLTGIAIAAVLAAFLALLGGLLMAGRSPHAGTAALLLLPCAALAFFCMRADNGVMAVYGSPSPMWLTLRSAVMADLVTPWAGLLTMTGLALLGVAWWGDGRTRHPAAGLLVGVMLLPLAVAVRHEPTRRDVLGLTQRLGLYHGPLGQSLPMLPPESGSQILMELPLLTVDAQGWQLEGQPLGEAQRAPAALEGLLRAHPALQDRIFEDQRGPWLSVAAPADLRGDALRATLRTLADAGLDEVQLLARAYAWEDGPLSQTAVYVRFVSDHSDGAAAGISWEQFVQRVHAQPEGELGRQLAP